jgi:hypothetical protein
LILCTIYANVKMIPIEIISGMVGDKGEWWRG